MPTRMPSLSLASGLADGGSGAPDDRDDRDGGNDRGGRGGLPAKLYFRIGEVADLVGVEPHVLRYWEREFRTIRPSKSAKGQRVYSQKDVAHLVHVRDLLYTQGFTIAGAKKQIHEGVAEAAPRPTGRGRTAPLSAPFHAPAPQFEPRFEPEFQPEFQPERATEIAGASPAHGPYTSAPVLPVPSISARVREELLAMRGEIEAFLQDLDA